MRTIAVTGVTGKSGQAFLQNLLDKPEMVRDYHFLLLCRRKDPLVEQVVAHSAIKAESLQIDLKDQEALRGFFGTHGVDMVFHIASVHYSWNIVPAALEHGVNDFVLVHTTGIYSKYKAAGEAYRKTESKISELVEQYRRQGRNVAVTILRPTMIYGDLQDGNVSVFMKMTDKLRLLPVVNGARYDLQPVWSKDLGNAYFKVLSHWPATADKEYILSGGVPIQLREMFVEMGKQLGVRNVFVPCPFWLAYAGAWILFLLSLGKCDFREKVQRLVEPRAYGHELATQDFGYDPVDFAQGVEEEIWMYQQSKK